MTHFRRFEVLAAVALSAAAAVGATAAPGAALAAPGHATTGVATGRPGNGNAPPGVRAVCPPPAPGRFGCFALLRTGVRGGFGVRGPAAAAAGHWAAAALPPGYGPAQFRSAYHLPATGGKGQTVAVVDAGGDPQAAADLAVYRATYHLPPCTTATGCFRQVNQHGTPSPLPHDQGWGPEISLDLDMVSAACPSCHILLADANSASFNSLAGAVDTAARLGATEISNSYGAPEQAGLHRFKTAYSHPGVAVVAASGDAGYYIPSFPAVFTTVIAAGTNILPGGPHCGRDYQCHAIPGYDGPTGNGTPNGLAGF